MKFPNVTGQQCDEIINYIQQHNNTRPMVLKHNLSYYQIKKIIRVLTQYETIEEKDKKIKEIQKINTDSGVLIKDGIVDHKVNYMRHRDYYMRYNKERARKKIEKS